MSFRDELLARMRAAGCRDPETRIHGGMTVQRLVQLIETHEGRVNGVEPRWQWEMRTSEPWPGIERAKVGPL